MHNIYYIHTTDVYLLHVSVLVHHPQAEQLCQFLEKRTTVITLLSTVFNSVAYREQCHNSTWFFKEMA